MKGDGKLIFRSKLMLPCVNCVHVTKIKMISKSTTKLHRMGVGWGVGWGRYVGQWSVKKKINIKNMTVQWARKVT